MYTAISSIVVATCWLLQNWTNVERTNLKFKKQKLEWKQVFFFLQHTAGLSACQNEFKLKYKF